MTNFQMYILGGLIDDELTRTSEKLSGDQWTNGPSLPEGRARFVTFVSSSESKCHIYL
jgi:hypothetical protein